MRSLQREVIIFKMEEYESLRKSIDDNLCNILLTYKDSPLYHVMEKSLEGGKRLRSIIMWKIYSSILSVIGKGTFLDISNPIFSIPDLLHSSSLIIDDMPYFDDDNERRGMETIHKKYGSTKAHSASMAILSIALSIITNHYKENSYTAIEMITNLLGVNGAIDGQIKECLIKAEMTPGDEKMEERRKALKEIIRKKTSNFFKLGINLAFFTVNIVQPLSFCIGEKLNKLGDKIGLIYQIIDDIKDLDEDMKKGKSRINYCFIVGRDAAMKKIKKEREECIEILKSLDIMSPFWDYFFNSFLDI